MATREELYRNNLVRFQNESEFTERDFWDAAFLAGRESMEKEFKYINVYHDAEYNGRFISNFEHATFDEAFKARDQVENYIETIGVIRQAIGESK